MTINFDSIRTSSNTCELNLRFQEICHDHGVSQFALSSLSRLAGDFRFEIDTNYPTQWIKHYIGQHCFEYDPVYVNPMITALPFFWDQYAFKEMTLVQQKLFDMAYDFGIKSGTTIPLNPFTGAQRYLTLLNFDLTDNFDYLFWLRAAGEEFFYKKNELEANSA